MVASLMVDRRANLASASLHVQLGLKLPPPILRVHLLTSMLLRLLAAEAGQVRVGVRVLGLKLEQSTFRWVTMGEMVRFGYLRLLGRLLKLLVLMQVELTRGPLHLILLTLAARVEVGGRVVRAILVLMMTRWLTVGRLQWLVLLRGLLVVMGIIALTTSLFWPFQRISQRRRWIKLLVDYAPPCSELRRFHHFSVHVHYDVGERL